MPEKEASLIEPPTSGIAYGKPKRCSFSANPSRYQAAPSICALLTSILLFSCQNSADVLNRVQINANTSSSTSSTPLTDAKAPEEAGAPVIPIVIDPEAPSCIVAEELSNTGALYLPSLSSTGEVVVKDNITGVLGSVFGTHISVVKGPYGSEQALRFDATNDDSYVSFPYNSNLNQFTGSVDFYFYPERCGDSPEWDTLVS